MTRGTLSKIFCIVVVAAHHTQFVDVGWLYLARNAGSGNLTGNGTYVSYRSPSDRELTIVIEIMVEYSMKFLLLYCRFYIMLYLF